MKVDISHEEIERITSDLLQELQSNEELYKKNPNKNKVRLMVIEAHRVTEQKANEKE